MTNSSIKKRFSDYEFRVGFLPYGTLRSIADVPGVRVGHTTKIEGDRIRTGVTLIDPGIPNLLRKKLPAAIAVGNGYGKMAGFTQVEELGQLEAPIALTNTLAVGPVMRAIIDHVLADTQDLGPLDSVNVVVSEVNDGRLNDLHANSVGAAEVERAFAALSEQVGIGNVGGGTGARAFSWKGGIGTASRRIIVKGETYTLGVLVQTNYGGSLTILGVPVGLRLGKMDFQIPQPPSDGSCTIVLATDAPLSARQLKRIAQRTFLGLGRTGAVLNHSSGDYAIAFSTNRHGLEGSGEFGSCLADEDLPNFFLAAVEGTEESVYDAIFAAETMTSAVGTGRLDALPTEAVLEMLRQVNPTRLYE